jgi:PTH1 family peptidyl-tRNA hydrolase
MHRGMNNTQTPPAALIVGLGNPGKAYASHRHNVGFMVIQRLARAHSIRLDRRQRRVRLGQGTIAGHPALLAMPQTFMNLSGQAVRPLLRRYAISPTQMLVVYDDLDLPLGWLRLRPEGGSGGHKGMQSLIEHLGTRQFPRLRLGIDRPPGRMDPADYVLTPFRRDQQTRVDEVLDRAVTAVECWLREGIVAAMNAYNPGPADSPPGNPRGS